jgi:DNA repair protein SbcC/Rad50
VRNIQPALTVHIAQFAALLRDCQVVIAVHERALFDYLALELSLEGKAVVTPRAFGFEDDRATAARFAGDRRP